TPLGAPNQVHKVDVRFIATCNKNLLDLVANGEFREDLYYRLALFRLSLPPLSKRKFNMAKVVQHFEAELLETYPALHSGRRISPKALKLISLLNWPGNFRELRGVVFQVVGYADRTTNSDIGLPELYGMLLESEIAAPRLAELAQAIRSNNALLLEVLRASPDNYSLAADIAGISRPTLYKRMEQNNWQRGIDC
ncbi:MAG: sigma 54-interacting transcriptional regulator, partial [Rhodospirillaceae bacterium]